MNHWDTVKKVRGIYKVTNKVNGKVYIGQSVDIGRRWRQHMTAEDDIYFHKAIQKYGVENFEWEVIEKCKKSELDERESYWIEYYDSYNKGYNCTKGGGGCSGEANPNWKGGISLDSEYSKKHYEANKEKAKEYYEANKDKIIKKIKEKNKQYYEENKEKMREKAKEYREANKDKIKEKAKEYREVNKEKEKERHRQYYEANKEKAKEYYEANKEKVLESAKQRYEANKEKRREYNKQHYINKKRIKKNIS